MRKEHIALHITIFVQQNLYKNDCTYNTFYSWWNMSLLLVEAFAEVVNVNTEALNIKSCQPRQKHCRRKAEAKCIFIELPRHFICRGKKCWNSRAAIFHSWEYLLNLNYIVYLQHLNGWNRRQYFSRWLAGLELGTFSFRAQVANHKQRRTVQKCLFQFSFLWSVTVLCVSSLAVLC